MNEEICPVCEGNGFTIEVEAQCCGNYSEPFVCCMNPRQVQVQVECKCNKGYVQVGKGNELPELS